MAQTCQLQVTRRYTVVVDLERGEVADIHLDGSATARAQFIPNSPGEAEAIAILRRDARFPNVKKEGQ